MEKKTIGSFIATLRKANGYTQQELADLLHVSNKTISSWETDNSLPDLSMIPVIADIFNVSCDELLKGEKSISTQEENESRVNNKKAEKAALGIAKKTLRSYQSKLYLVYACFAASNLLMYASLIAAGNRGDALLITFCILIVLGAILYVTGLFLLCSYTNSYKGQLYSEDFSFPLLYRTFEKKALFARCLYSFFLLSPLFCFFYNRKMKSDSTYQIKEEEVQMLKKNRKTKTIFYSVVGGIIAVLLIVLIILSHYDNHVYLSYLNTVCFVIPILVILSAILYFILKKKIAYYKL